MKKIQLFDHAEAKSSLRASILALASILSTVSTSPAQESVSSKLHPETLLPRNRLVTTIDLGFNVFPFSIVVSPDSKTIYVGSLGHNGGLVSVIDSQTNTATDTIPVGGLPDILAIAPDGSTLYVGNSGSANPPSPIAVDVISTATKTVTATIAIPLTAGLAVSPDGKNVYLTDPNNHAVSIIQTATNQFTQDAISVGDFVQHIAVSPDGKTAYVSANEKLSAIDLVSKQVIATIPLQPNRFDIAPFLTFSPDGQKLYLNRRRTVVVVDPSSNQIVRRIKPGLPRAVGPAAITPDGSFLYLPCGFAADKIVMLDTSTYQVVGRLIRVQNPEALAVAPSNKFAYAFGLGPSGTGVKGFVYVINISPE